MLQVRYHPAFCGEKTLLFAGSSSEIDLLRQAITKWNGDQIDLIVHLGGPKNLCLFSAEEIHLKRANGNKMAWNDDRGTWGLSVMSQSDLIGSLDRLLQDNKPCREYIVDNGPTRIAVSKDELPVTGKGQIVEKPALSAEGVAFTPQSVDCIRQRMKIYQQQKLVSALFVTYDKHGRPFVAIGGNHTPRPQEFKDQVGDVSFNWYTPWLDRIRDRYIVDLDTHTKSYLIPVPGLEEIRS